MKQYFKSAIEKLLWLQVKRLRQKYNPTVIVVAGSVGKTTTKSAVATVLSQHLKVAWQQGNYNVPISAPLIFFNQKIPTVYNILGWLKVFIVSEYCIQASYPNQVVLLELGVDQPGDMKEFKKYLRADYGILTAVAPEHMENFNSLEAVAKEELAVSEIVDTLLIDIDNVPKKYYKHLVNFQTYGQSESDCRLSIKPLTKNLERPITLSLKDEKNFKLQTKVIAKQSLQSFAAAALLANSLELSSEEIERGLSLIAAVPGRMHIFEGLKGTLLIDDTYNSSPKAALAALDTLYEIPGKHKIAVLGQMNELGDASKVLHQQVGEYCDPKKLDLVITIGPEANQSLASAAEKRGCNVMRCPTPDHAADVAERLIQDNTVILFKGSQNGVFAEEAVKELLANSSDVSKLVRQSRSWLKIKERQFSK